MAAIGTKQVFKGLVLVTARKFWDGYRKCSTINLMICHWQ